MTELFEWDPKKALANFRKHGVSFEEAESVFLDPNALTTYDPIHSSEEDRFVTVGTTAIDRQIVVVHTVRNDRIRVISARPANRRERGVYAEEKERR